MIHKPTSHKAVNFLQRTTNDLKTIFERVRSIKRIQKQVISHFEPNVAKHCQVANVVSGKLVLLVNSASLATQIRYQARDILAKFAKDPALQHIKYIEPKVRQFTEETTSQPEPPPRKKMARLSEETSNLLHELADSIEDPKIREIMHRIATNKK